jgi:large-conductance mechanosensitive channel
MDKLRQFVAENKTKIIWTLVIVLVLVALFVFGVQRYGWDWTGFFSYTTPKSDTEEFHPGKTLWDVLNLAIIPLALVLIAYIFNKRQKESELEIAQKQREQDLEIAQKERELDREIAQDRQREAALQAYLDRMMELLRNELGDSEPDEKVKAVAQTLTVVTMRRLDGRRNETLLRFLIDAGIEPIISFKDADLTRVDLSQTTSLPEIDLSTPVLQ